MNESQKPDPSRQTSSEQADPAPSIHTDGDYVGGDKAGGDKVMGNKIVQYITNHPAIAPEKDGVRVYEHGRYNLASQFVGRQKELAKLDAWLSDEYHPMFIINALSGSGKSALAWYWLEKVKAQEKPTFEWIIWYRFDEPGQVDTFLTDVLTFWGEKPLELGSKRNQLSRLQEILTATPTLVVLDGVEQLLRFYSGMNAAYRDDVKEVEKEGRKCVDPVSSELLKSLSQLKNGSKSLLTSRQIPSDLQGQGVEKLPDRIARLDLTGLDQNAAYNFFIKWGIRTTRAEVNAVCAPLDYHPLSMALLAGHAAEDFEMPGDLRAAANYDPTVKLIDGQQHILQRAYDTLQPETQNLLSRLAAFRNAVTWETVKAVFGSDDQRIGDNLESLIRRGLVQRSEETKEQSITFDLHPIVRRYAYRRLEDPHDIHTRLIEYYENVPLPPKIGSLSDLVPQIERYHHLTCAGKFDDAFMIFYFRLHSTMYYQLGAYQKMVEMLRALFSEGEDKPPNLSREDAMGWTLNTLADIYCVSGQPMAAFPLYQQQITIAECQNDHKSTVIGLNDLAYHQMRFGMLAEAARNLGSCITLSRKNMLSFEEAKGHLEYGNLLAYCGNWLQSYAELDAAQKVFDWYSPGETNYGSIVLAVRAITALLQGNISLAQTMAQKTLRLTDEVSQSQHPYERDYIKAHWLLGWAALGQGNYQECQARLDEALRRCRAINLVEFEPAILLAQARLARATGQTSRSHAYAQQAVTIAQRAGYVLDLADIHNHLAHLALDANDPATARSHAQTARDYAFCDGPPYAYQTALDEAERLLNSLSQA